MPEVQTVGGPVDVTRLGRTLMHEHVVVVRPEMFVNYGNYWGAPYWDEEAGVADAIAALRRARLGGIETIVDPTAPGFGRNVSRIKRIAARVDINIIVATGLYIFLELPSFLAYRSDDVLTDMFVREIREGINETGVKAAFLKCAVEKHGIIADVPRILAAVAAASVETGAPIMVHTDAASKTGLPALAALTAHGVDPAKIVIAHAGDSNDLDYLRAIADTGAWLGCDRFSIEHFNRDADRIATLVKLIDNGYIDRIHLAHDAASFFDFMAENPRFKDANHDFLWISSRVLPALRKAGITQAQIDQIMIDNPRRFFS